MDNRNRFWILMGCLAIALGVVCLVLVSRIQEGWARAFESGASTKRRIVGRLALVEGSGERKAAGSRTWSPARNDMELFEDDLLRTRGETRGLALLGNINRLLLEENTIIVLDTANLDGSTRVTLNEGSFSADSSDKGLFIDLGGTRISAKPRQVGFDTDLGPIPRTERERVDGQHRLVARMATALENVQEADEARAAAGQHVKEAVAHLEGDRLDEARASLAEAWELLAPHVRVARGTGAVKLEVSRIREGRHSIRVLEGKAVIRAPVRTLSLETGSGVILGDELEQAEVRPLAPPPEPFHPEPYRTVYNVSRIPLRWDGVQGATGYTVELSRDPDFVKLMDQWRINPDDEDPVGDVYDGEYYWRVRALDEDEIPGLPGVGVFRVATDHDPPAVEVTSVSPWVN